MQDESLNVQNQDDRASPKIRDASTKTTVLTLTDEVAVDVGNKHVERNNHEELWLLSVDAEG